MDFHSNDEIIKQQKVIDEAYNDSEIGKLSHAFYDILELVDHSLFFNDEEAGKIFKAQRDLSGIGADATRDMVNLSILTNFNELARKAGQENANGIDFIAFAISGDKILECQKIFESTVKHIEDVKKSSIQASSKSFKAFKK